jgi:hypothetical protein
VTKSQLQNWKPDKIDKRDGVTRPFISLSAGPGTTGKRIEVALGESVMTERAMSGNDRPPRRMLDLGIEAWIPMRPGGFVTFREPITVAQALSFEEAVRAVFRAAREEGILPPLAHDEL